MSANVEVEPTLDDRDIAAGSEVLGAPVGRSARRGTGQMALIVATVVALAGYALSIFARTPCISNGFNGIGRYTHLCYSDIPVLYSLRGFADGRLPYLDHIPGQQGFEYPVLTGAFAQIGAWLTPIFGGGGIGFYAANVLLLGICFLVTVLATGAAARPRNWDAVLLASAPALLVAATINWDLLAVALTAVWLLLWSRKLPGWAGVVLGLAIAAKFYPLVLCGPMLLLCLRSARMSAFWRMMGTAALAWLAVNVPVMIMNFEGWSEFYTFSQTRGQDFGSPWLALSIAGFGVPPGILNTVASTLFLIACLAIGALIIFSPRRPRVAPMLFLVLAAFLITNKVYSPQYVVWLVPLAVLARPRLRDLIVWQAGELVYFAAIWWYLAGLQNPNKGLPGGWYAVAIWIHIGVTIWFAALLVRDALRPAKDPVRGDGPDLDDPQGGVLDGAPDRPGWPSNRRAVPSHSVTGQVRPSAATDG